MLMTQTATTALHHPATTTTRTQPTTTTTPTTSAFASSTGLAVKLASSQSSTGAASSISRVATTLDSIHGLTDALLHAGPKGAMYVRALYDYDADDRTSLSFHEGDVIQVITRLESGWWDGIINGVRGWFPSNYCQVIASPRPDAHGMAEEGEETELDEDDEEELDEYDAHDASDEGESDYDEATQLPLEGIDGHDHGRADFWIPQATSDGRLFYFNTETGESSMELPLESPTAMEAGPRDMMHVTVPEKSEAPMAMTPEARTYHELADGDATSQSESELPRRTTSSLAATQVSVSARQSSRAQTDRDESRKVPHEGLSPATSLESITPSTQVPSNIDPIASSMISLSNISSLPAAGPSSTSFTHISLAPPAAAAMPRSFFDDGAAAPLTWNRLITNMKTTVDRYKEAINQHERAEFVRCAEDISDHLRLLLAAGSGTTDNHSGQPSIISTNRALYPHFREMMSKFSKLVISSHIAAADWPTADSAQKCLLEADGVMAGVYSYVEIARQQRGEDIPRLLPGFVLGSTIGGSWQNNGLSAKDAMTTNFLDEDELPAEPSANLDDSLVDRVDDLKRMLTASIRKLEEHLVLTEKIITPYRHEIIGNAICAAAHKVLDVYKPWIATVESINLSSLGKIDDNPALGDLLGHKQSVYDSMSDLLLGCQSVAAPLGDEWSETRGEPLEGRLNHVRQCCRSFETTSSHVVFSLQLLAEQVSQNLQKELMQTMAASERAREGKRSDSLPQHRRDESRHTYLRPSLATMGHSQSFTEGDPTAPQRKSENSKVRKFFGEEPVSQEMPEYLKLDHEDDISYDTKVQPPQLKGGTFLALVEQLTRHDKLDSNFNNTFLLTYRSFTTARELFAMLVKRFQVQPPEGMPASDYETWRDRKQKPIRFRVVNILKSWLDNFWMEDQSDETKALIRDIYTFARDTVKTTETPGSGPLMTVLEQRLRGQEVTAKRLVLTLNTSTPQPIMPKNMKKLKFLDIDPMEFARQLTIVESKLYGKIRPTECLNKTWSSKKVGDNDLEPAPNVKALILHSNQLTNWVAEMILTQLDPKKRVVVIKHFVAVADKCRSLNNFSTLTSIISALGTAPIHRLKRTWDGVPGKTLSVLESMRRLMGSTKNFGEYRESLHLANPPCVPFFGIYLTDLTFIEDGIPSIIKKTDLINFAKRAKTAEVIRDIQQYQNVPYPLQPVSELQEYILSNMQAAGDVHEMYEKSLQVEPREREDEKIVRVLAESGFL